MIVAFPGYTHFHKVSIAKRYDFFSSNSLAIIECEGGIEKPVPRIAVWHHEACRGMANSDP